jgi:hypothetical protein
MKDFLKVVAGLVVFFAVAVGALTLMRNITRQPSVILTDIECTPPCWSGIKPGETTSRQVYEILNQLESVDKNSIMGDYGRNGDKLSEIYWFFRRPVEDSGGSIYFDNDRVTAIKILAINSLRLSDLFEKFGQPESYWVEIGRGENREFLKVYLLYPQIGCVATVIIDTEGSTNQVDIQATTPVYRVTYFAPEKYQELLKTRTLIDKPVNARSGSFQTWSDFGTIEFERK